MNQEYKDPSSADNESRIRYASTNSAINTTGTYAGPSLTVTPGERAEYRVGIDAGFPNQIRPINITQVNYGYIVVIGCQTIVVETKERLIAKLAEYITNPSATEQKYNNKQLL